ncbi:FAD-dependent monooxygenase [Orrella sp. 11846]|uniref:FAD-dependent monooxygenase n=1 Tax=Orrella sp. 11846 TaxID=3409913 RepID=UPI003B5CB960
MKKHSIVVCGAGLAGMSMALDLAKRGVHDLLLLGPPVPVAEQGPDDFGLRVYAISKASQAYLQRLGVWDMIPEQRLTPVDAMEIFGDAFGAVHLRAWQAARQELNWIVESVQIERVLIQALRFHGVHWIHDTLETFRHRVGQTRGGQTIQADLWIGADGTNSTLRQQAGIALVDSPYDATGVVGHLTCEKPHQGVALQWFQKDMVLALLPLPDTSAGHQVSMVWAATRQAARDLLALPEDEQAQFLQTHLGEISRGRLGQLTLNSIVRGFDLTLARSDMIGDGVALIGDAAHRVHPLAGQGLNLGLSDARVLGELVTGRELFFDAGDPTLLRRYRRARAKDILEMQLLTDGLKRLFDLELPGARWIRNAGMAMVDRLPPVKRILIEAATRTPTQ